MQMLEISWSHCNIDNSFNILPFGLENPWVNSILDGPSRIPLQHSLLTLVILSACELIDNFFEHKTAVGEEIGH